MQMPTLITPAAPHPSHLEDMTLPHRAQAGPCMVRVHTIMLTRGIVFPLVLELLHLTK